MEDEIPEDIMIPKIFNTPERLIPTLTEEGFKAVNESDFRDWLAENQHERPPGSGPNGEWTVGDEEIAMRVYNEQKILAENEGEELSFGDRPPYDALADTMKDQGYDFSPEGEEARRSNGILQSGEPPGGDMASRRALYDKARDAYDLALEKKNLYARSRERTEGAAKKAMSGGHPEGYIVHPDGFTEYFEDPAVTAQAEKDTQQSAAQYRLNQMKANTPKRDADG